MKRLLALTVCVILLAFSACIGSDYTQAKSGDYLILSVTLEVEEDSTLIDYMNRIKGSKSLTNFKIKNGMLTVINGMQARGNVYWMLYTDDSEYSNSDWGTVEIEGITYYSATLGAESLPIKQGCTYVWYAQAF